MGRNEEDGETKAKMFNAAVRLFSEQGYDATTVRQIAAKADVNTASVYWFFENKKAVLNEILETFGQKLQQYLFTEAEAKRLIATKTPRQILELCLPVFKKNENEFMYYAYRIVIMEQFTNPIARDIIVGQLHEITAKGIQYMLDLLVESGKIPRMDTAFLAELWTRSIVFDSMMWMHFLDPQNMEDIAAFQIFNKQLIENVLSGEGFPYQKNA